MHEDDSRTVSRRAALGAMGVGAVAGIAAGSGVTASLTASASSTTKQPIEAQMTAGSVSAWSATRGNTYFIAHRGSGDVYPEHSLIAYRAAVALGAQCLEVSVQVASDRVLVCMHDSTYDRTTTTSGAVSSLPSTILRSVRLLSSQLGPAWDEEPPPQVPFFDDVLRELGGHVVLCIEAKDDNALEPMMSLITKLGLAASVIAKVYFKSTSLQVAKRAGFPVFAYFGSYLEVTASEIMLLSKRLDPMTDYMVLPAYGAGPQTYVDDALVRAAVATGIPVWVYPLHRRVDAKHFFTLGVQGAITSSFGYVSSKVPVANSDGWKYKVIMAGEITKDPTVRAYDLSWTGPDELSLTRVGGQHFVVMGNLCPVATATSTYEIDVSVSLSDMPMSPDSAFVLAFAHLDDSYYDLGSARGNGYDAVFRVDGGLQLLRHKDGITIGAVIGHAESEAPKTGSWTNLRLHVTSTSITWSRLNDRGGVVAGQIVTVNDTSYRGGYIHVGRSSVTGVMSIRALSVRKLASN